MSSKKTAAQLEEEARRAEARAKKLRAQAKKQTQAEEAKLNVDIIKAVEEWRQSYPNPIDKKDLPQKFREWAEKNRQKYSGGQA